LPQKEERPTKWIDNLPEEKKREVEIIMQENKLRLLDKLPPPGPDGKLPDRDVIREIMQENDLILQQELRSVLTEEEYQQFRNSHPAPVLQPPNLAEGQANQ
jgi:hypothetical protein